MSKIVFAPIYLRGAIEVAAEFCFTLVAVNGPRAKVSMLRCCSAVFTTDAPDVYVLIMKTLIRKCTEKGVIFQLVVGVICFFLRPWVGKLQVARRRVEWSAKDCICNKGILYIILSTPLPELLDSTLILLRESKFSGRFIPNRCPLKMSVFSKEND